MTTKMAIGTSCPVVIRRSSNLVISRRSSANNANITQNDEKHERILPLRECAEN